MAKKKRIKEKEIPEKEEKKAGFWARLKKLFKK